MKRMVGALLIPNRLMECGCYPNAKCFITKEFIHKQLHRIPKIIDFNHGLLGVSTSIKIISPTILNRKKLKDSDYRELLNKEPDIPDGSLLIKIVNINLTDNNIIASNNLSGFSMGGVCKQGKDCHVIFNDKNMDLLNLKFSLILSQVEYIERGLVSEEQIINGCYYCERKKPESWHHTKYILSVEINGEHELEVTVGGIKKRYPHFHVKTMDGKINSRFYFNGDFYDNIGEDITKDKKIIKTIKMFCLNKEHRQELIKIWKNEMIPANPNNFFTFNFETENPEFSPPIL
jgi:hypothetical protein